MSSKISYVSPGVIDVADETGAKTRMQFTSTGQVASITDPLNRVTQFAYDANDYLKQITAPGNTLYKFSYDAQGRLLSQTDPLSRAVSFTYAGSSDSPLSVTDQLGNKMNYSYDGSGQLTGITYANSKSELFTYSASGQLIKAVERSGDTFLYSYDANGRLSRKTFDDSTYEQYSYDGKGNLATVRDVGSKNTQMVYDAQNRLTKITYPNGRFLQYAYDAAGRRTQMVDHAGFTTNYSYDAAGRLAKLTNGAGATVISYVYDAAGRLSKETNGNGTYTTYGYDAAGQLTGIVNRKADNTINSLFQYTYDSLGRQTKAVTSDGTWTYTYDGIGQLSRAQFASTNASIVNQDLQYTYDAAGNRTRAVVNGVTTNYAANNLNQYTTVGGATHTYDADGNLIQVVNGTNITSYTYNDENRLIGVTSPTGSWTYEYDAFGNRTASIQNGVRTEYLVDPFGLGDVVGEYSGGTASNYVHGLGLVGRFNGGNAAYYDSDAIGSTVGLTNAAGNYVNRYVYRPYGENLVTTEGVANPFEYVGQWGVMDEASGLDYMRARFYNSKSGQFAAVDPLGLAAGDTNFYRYALNDPLGFIDPDGENPYFLIGLGLGIGLGIGLAVGLALHKGPLIQNNGTIDINSNNGSNNASNNASNNGNGSGNNNLSGNGNNNFPKPPKPKPKPIGSSKDKPRTGNPSIDDAAGSAGRRVFDPLVLDLDGDGIELVSLEQSTALFDLNADGFREQTGWVKADDGMLALDANGDGKINNINELFGDALTDGFDELATLDSNKDKVINASDAKFSSLRIWQDLDQDGITDNGELKTLAQLGIRSISLNTTETSVNNEGNLIRTTSKYTRTDNTQRDVVALWFAADQLNTTYDQPYQLKTETLFLPTTRGYGQLPDLYIAASLDSQLLGLIRDFAGLTVQTLDQSPAKIEQILFRWAKVDGVNPTSRGEYFDARKLGFLEKFLQQNLDINFRSVQQALFVQQAWDIIVEAVSARLLVQGAMRDLFPNATYSINSDSITIGDDLSTTLNRLSTNIPTGAENTTRYWNYAILILDDQSDRFNLTQVDYDTQIKTALGSSGLSAYLDALRNPVYGSAGNDLLSVSGGLASFLDGGAGNDTLAGTAQNDIINGGAGNDIIISEGGIDLIDGGTGTDSIGIVADYSTATSALSINDISPPPLTLPNGTQIKNVETQWFTRLNTGSGNDTITFAARQDNTIYAGVGNDTINPGLGTSDRVDGGVGNDLLRLDYSKGDTGTRLYFYIDTYGNSNTAVGYRNTSGGSTLDDVRASNIERFNITGTSKDDDITTWTGNDTVNSGAGNDTVNSGAGNDTVNSGAGNDTVNSGEGNDTVNSGDGDDGVTSGGGVDTLDGGAGFDYLNLNLGSQIVSLNISNLSNISIAGVVTATNFERFDITAGSGNDTVTQSGIVNGAVVRSDDTISTGSGNDTINAGLGSYDRVFGDDGNDLLIVDYSKGDTGTGMTFVGYDGPSGNYARRLISETNSDSLDYIAFYEIERFNVTGTSKDDDIVTLNGNDIINAGAGNDTIRAGGGNDTVNAGDGDDSVASEGSTGTFDGGAGFDYLSLNLGSQTANLNISNLSNISIAGVVTATNFERFDITTGSGNDTVTQAGVVNGAVVRSDDTISTGSGNDTINAGLGAYDRVFGDDGNDLLIVDYSKGDTGTGMTFIGYNDNFTDGYARRSISETNSNSLDYIVFYGIERFNITGTSKNDTISSWNGTDIINAGAGNDIN